MEAVNGMIVRVIAGHEKNQFMVITAVDGVYAFLADGRSRTLEKPKKKKLMHIRLTKTVIDMKDVTDKKLRSVIADFEKGLMVSSR